MVISLGTAPSKDLTADDSFPSHTSWSSTDSYYIEENEKKDILKFGVLEGGREINLLKVIWFLVLRVRKYFGRHLKIERYSDNHLVDGVERWKMFRNIFENWKIFWKLFGWWFWEEVEDILKYSWNMQDILKIERYFENWKIFSKLFVLMVLRGGGGYFEICLKIARYFENGKIFWKLFGWWCWEGVEGSTQENLDGSWSGARHKTNFQTFVHQIINHVHTFIHFSCCKHSVIETNYASYLVFISSRKLAHLKNRRLF